MVEGSRIDHAAHGNDAAGHLHDILAFDKAVAAALAFAEQDGQTLIVSTSDHETGGLTLGRNINGQGVYTWDPEVLSRIQKSNEQIIRDLAAGADWHTIIREDLGMVALSVEDSTALAENIERRNLRGFLNEMNAMVSRAAVLGWTTLGHTAVDVNLYAYGPGATLFVGNHDNTRVGGLIAELLGFDLEAHTRKLRDRMGTE